MADSKYRCPSCGKLYDFGVFVCPDCEAIVNHTLIETAPQPPKEPTVIRRMLSPTDAELEKPEPTFPGAARPTGRTEVTSPTVLVPYPEPRDGVPRLRTDIDLQDLQLTVYEAFVLSRIDGSSTVEVLRSELALSRLEISVVLGTLKDKGVLEVFEPSVAPPSRPPGAVQPPTAPPPARSATPPSPPRATTPPPRSATAAATAPATATAPAPAAARATPPTRPAPAPRKKVLLGVPGTERLSGAQSTVDGPDLPPPQRADAAVESPLQQAIRLENSGDLAGAIRLLEAAIQSSRAPASLYNRLAIALIKERRDYFRAEELLNRAIQLDPGNPTYSSNLAKVLIMIASYSGLVPIPEDAKKW